MWLAMLLIFIAIPLLELALLIKLAQWIGFWPTVIMVVSTAIAGIIVMQQQGLAAMGRAVEAVAQGKPPVEPVVDGALLLVAGMLLLTPGLLTDVAGVLLLIPPVRRFVARKSFEMMLRNGSIHVETYQQETRTYRSGPSGPGGGPGEGTIIEGDYTRVDEPSNDPRLDRKR